MNEIIGKTVAKFEDIADDQVRITFTDGSYLDLFGGGVHCDENRIDYGFHGGKTNDVPTDHTA